MVQSQTNNPTQSELPRYLSQEECAVLLKRTKKAVSHLVARGQLKRCSKPGQKMLFKPEDVRAFVEGS
jgi:hypothetical protein